MLSELERRFKMIAEETDVAKRIKLRLEFVPHVYLGTVESVKDIEELLAEYEELDKRYDDLLSACGGVWPG